MEEEEEEEVEVEEEEALVNIVYDYTPSHLQQQGNTISFYPLFTLVIERSNTHTRTLISESW